MTVKEWIIDWFVKNSNMEKNVLEQNTKDDFLAKCWIDSLKFVEFISDIEGKFNIKFSNTEFQNRMFSTVEGLVQIIEDKINGKV